MNKEQPRQSKLVTITSRYSKIVFGISIGLCEIKEYLEEVEAVIGKAGQKDAKKSFKVGSSLIYHGYSIRLTTMDAYGRGTATFLVEKI